MKIYQKMIMININTYFLILILKKKLILDENYNGQFSFFFKLVFKKVYDTNKYEAQLNNDFNFNSFDFISNKGIVTDYSFY